MKSAMGFLVDSYVVYCLKIDFPNQHYCVTFKKTKTKETWFTNLTISNYYLSKLPRSSKS